jgi:hypothetical protein
MSDHYKGSEAVTAAMIRTAVERLRANTVPPPHTHVVPPSATGWTSCWDCGQMVWAGPRSSE